MDELLKWFANNGGQIIGGALGVLVGYFASELFSRRKQARERERVRVLIAEEVTLNLSRVARLKEAIDQSDGFRTSTARGLVLHPRPAFGQTGVTVQLSRVPDALSETELKRVLVLQDDLNSLLATWDLFRAGYDSDQGARAGYQTHTAGLGRFETSQPTLPANALASAVELSWDDFEGTITRILKRDANLATTLRKS